MLPISFLFCKLLSLNKGDFSLKIASFNFDILCLWALANSLQSSADAKMGRALFTGPQFVKF